MRMRTLTHDAVSQTWKRLQRARRATLTRRRRVLIPCLTLGLPLVLCYGPLEALRCRSEGFLPRGGSWISAGTLLVFLAVQPTNSPCCRLSSGCFVLTFLCAAVSSAQLCSEAFLHLHENSSRSEVEEHFLAAAFLLLHTLALSAAVVLLTSACRLSTLGHLNLLWRCVGVLLPVLALLELGRLVARSGLGLVTSMADCTDGIVCLTLETFTGLVVVKNSMRLRLQSWLFSEEHMNTAAAISALLGKHQPEEVRELALRTFRCISLDKVDEDAMKTNQPDPKLVELTSVAELGEVDAFISHSWSDEHAEKWAALQLWRRQFKALRHREPRVWIDKYCIDQQQMEDSLASLPLFLASCNKLLVLLGTSYLSRMWCVIELFTFVAIGRQPEDIEILLLGTLTAGDGEVNELKELQKRVKSIKTFNVKNANCVRGEDADRLRGVIEVSFPSLNDFNQQVISVLTTALGVLIAGFSDSSSMEHPSLSRETGLSV